MSKQFFWQSDTEHHVGDNVYATCGVELILTETPIDDLPSKIYLVEPLKPVTGCSLRSGRDTATKGAQGSAQDRIPARDDNYDEDKVFLCSKIRILVTLDTSIDIEVSLAHTQLGPKAPAHSMELPR